MFDYGASADADFAGDTPGPVGHNATGVALDGSRGALCVADGYGGAVIRVDGPRQQRIATIDAGGVFGAERIAGLVTTPHGTLYVSRVGHGKAGAIFRVE